MRPLPFLAAVVATIPCLAAEPPGPFISKAEDTRVDSDNINGDVGKLGGIWKVVSCQTKHGLDPNPGYAMFSGPTFMVATKGWTTASSFNFRVGKTEGKSFIALTEPHDLERRKQMPGIYSLNGDSLKICFSTEVNGPLPANFHVAGSEKLCLLTLKKVSLAEHPLQTRESSR